MNAPATEAAWRAHGAEIHRFLAARVGPTEADDLLQATFLKVHTHLDALKDGAQLRGWIYRIARNVVADHARARARLITPPIEASTEEAPSPWHDLIVASLEGFVDALSPTDREALRLVEFEGLSQVELAKRLGISVSGAKSRVQRARRRLRAGLEDCCTMAVDRYGQVMECEPTGGPCACD